MFMKTFLLRCSDENPQKVLPLQKCVEQAAETQSFRGSFKWKSKSHFQSGSKNKNISKQTNEKRAVFDRDTKHYTSDSTSAPASVNPISM